MKKRKKRYQDEVTLHERKKIVDELCEANNVPDYMGELFLSELKLSSEKSDRRAQRQAKILGLMQ